MGSPTVETISKCVYIPARMGLLCACEIYTSQRVYMHMGLPTVEAMNKCVYVHLRFSCTYGIYKSKYVCTCIWDYLQWKPCVSAQVS